MRKRKEWNGRNGREEWRKGEKGRDKTTYREPECAPVVDGRVELVHFSEPPEEGNEQGGLKDGRTEGRKGRIGREGRKDGYLLTKEGGKEGRK